MIALRAVASTRNNLIERNKYQLFGGRTVLNDQQRSVPAGGRYALATAARAASQALRRHLASV